MKKQAKKITKKIFILSLITSLVFTTCFSHKKIKVEAASVVGTLGAYTLYEICLYLGGLAVTALGVGYAYENRDEIAEFGKSVIDSMLDLPEQGWLLGSYTADSSYVYGSEALQEVQDTSWEVIQGGGQSPKNDDDNDDDGDKDADDRTLELDMTGFFLTEVGIQFFNNVIKPVYDDWVNEEEDNILDNKYGYANGVYHDHIVFEDVYYSNRSNWDVTKIAQRFIDLGLINNFQGYVLTADGYYLGIATNSKFGGSASNLRLIVCDSPFIGVYCYDSQVDRMRIGVHSFGGQFLYGDGSLYQQRIEYSQAPYAFFSSLPVAKSMEEFNAYKDSGRLPENVNLVKTYRVADWIAEDEYWKGYLEGIANSLRSLGDLVNIAQQLANSAYNNKPDAIAYGSMMTDLGQEYAPLEHPIIDPVYWPATNPTPQLDPSVFPNYQPSTDPVPDPVPDPEPDPGQNPDSGDPDNPDNPGNQDPDDMEIDLDGLLSLFNILFYIIMIIIMLIYLFLACLAFIVMIFRVPASSSMLPEEMVLGFEHLKTIMIPGMNISIYSFAMALIYMFIVFAVIKLLRHEINDFKIPRSK